MSQNKLSLNQLNSAPLTAGFHDSTEKTTNQTKKISTNSNGRINNTFTNRFFF